MNLYVLYIVYFPLIFYDRMWSIMAIKNIRKEP